MPHVIPVAALMIWTGLVCMGLGLLWLLGIRNPGWFLMMAAWATVVSFLLVGLLFAEKR